MFIGHHSETHRHHKLQRWVLGCCGIVSNCLLEILGKRHGWQFLRPFHEACCTWLNEIGRWQCICSTLNRNGSYSTTWHCVGILLPEWHYKMICGSCFATSHVIVRSAICSKITPTNWIQIEQVSMLIQSHQTAPQLTGCTSKECAINITMSMASMLHSSLNHAWGTHGITLGVKSLEHATAWCGIERLQNSYNFEFQNFKLWIFPTQLGWKLFPTKISSRKNIFCQNKIFWAICPRWKPRICKDIA